MRIFRSESRMIKWLAHCRSVSSIHTFVVSLTNILQVVPTRSLNVRYFYFGGSPLPHSVSLDISPKNMLKARMFL